MSEDQQTQVVDPGDTTEDKLEHPELGLSGERPITLRLVSDDRGTECNFWVGLKKHGRLTPKDILDSGKPMRDIFESVITDGVEDNSSLLLTDTTKSPPQYMYFLDVPSENFRDRAIWLGELTNTIKSWNPGSVGFYFSPEVMDEDEQHDLLMSILRELMRESGVADFYLMTGDYGTNSVLNAAVKLRFELIPESINLYVFH